TGEGHFGPGKGGGGEDGGARRNQTADDGFATHCLTTWRPRHRTNEAGSSEGRREKEALAAQSPALRYKLLPLASTNGSETRHYQLRYLVCRASLLEGAPYCTPPIAETSCTLGWH